MSRAGRLLPFPGFRGDGMMKTSETKTMRIGMFFLLLVMTEMHKEICL